MYDLIMSMEKGGHVETPYWVKEKRGAMKEMVGAGKVISKVTFAMMSGDIKVSPITATPSIVGFMKMIVGGSMGEWMQSPSLLRMPDIS